MIREPSAGAAVDLRALRESDLDFLAGTDGGPAWKRDRDIWQRYLAEQRDGERLVLLALRGGHIVGYGSLLRHSAYPPFRDAGIPEINDLVVAAGQRRQGLATRLIAGLETQARTGGAGRIGLGVGLYADYGPAQRLYIKLGYRPDGRGVTYREAPVPPGNSVPLDDDLILWLTKAL
ncbi:N-acetyltransferase family protein [Labrys neptuniae]